MWESRNGFQKRKNRMLEVDLKVIMQRETVVTQAALHVPPHVSSLESHKDADFAVDSMDSRKLMYPEISDSLVKRRYTDALVVDDFWCEAHLMACMTSWLVL